MAGGRSRRDKVARGLEGYAGQERTSRTTRSGPGTVTVVDVGWEAAWGRSARSDQEDVEERDRKGRPGVVRGRFFSWWRRDLWPRPPRTAPHRRTCDRAAGAHLKCAHAAQSGAGEACAMGGRATSASLSPWPRASLCRSGGAAKHTVVRGVRGTGTCSTHPRRHSRGCPPKLCGLAPAAACVGEPRA